MQTRWMCAQCRSEGKRRTDEGRRVRRKKSVRCADTQLPVLRGDPVEGTSGVNCPIKSFSTLRHAKRARRARATQKSNTHRPHSRHGSRRPTPSLAVAFHHHHRLSSAQFLQTIGTPRPYRCICLRSDPIPSIDLLRRSSSLRDGSVLGQSTRGSYGVACPQPGPRKGTSFVLRRIAHKVSRSFVPRQSPDMGSAQSRSSRLQCRCTISPSASFGQPQPFIS